MMAKQKTYIAIDLKSFYASVECKERNRDPLTTNLVVADKSRTEKTICLAVSPSLKVMGYPVDQDCLKLFKRSRKQITTADGKHQTEHLPVLPMTRQS